MEKINNALCNINAKELEELIEKYKCSNDSSLLFLEIINQERSETTVSLMLKYLFENDPECLKNVINSKYEPTLDNIEVTNVITEYYIYDDKRIDLLIEAKTNNQNIVIVIENKIDSSEHDNQCQRYYDYIKDRYDNSIIRYYFYLKPSNNLSIPNCKKFKTITYDDIYNCITNDEDPYIKDFKKCIERNYMNNKKNELELCLLNNFEYFYKKVNELHKDIEHFLQDEAAEEVKKVLGASKTEFYGGTHYTLRFYDSDCWNEDKDNKDNMYYFYVEIVAHDKEVSKFKFCRIIHAYTKNYNSRINRFVKSLKNVRTSEYGNNIWYIADSKEFKTDKSILSSEWKKELIEAAKVELKRMYLDMRSTVNDFKSYK